ncbi:MAG: helix-turn-helix transcriptional regulator [Clostridia bacterium]|nr:helix-turn-helix transcriptional regulator [Clostridia bacterium]
MFINKTIDGKNNLCGKIIAQKRLSLKLSQNQLAKLLQLNGLDIDKNAIQRIEAEKRFVTDIELVVLMKVLNFNISDLAN